MITYKNNELVIITSAVAGATSYAWVVFLGDAFIITITGNQLEIAPAAKFIIVSAGTTREVVRNIPVGVDVNVQVLAQNTAGKSSFSPITFCHTGS